MNQVPRRAFCLTLKLDADSMEELASALFNLATRADRGELSETGCSGSRGSGYVYDLARDATQTPERYVAALRAYLATHKGGTEMLPLLV